MLRELLSLSTLPHMARVCDVSCGYLRACAQGGCTPRRELRTILGHFGIEPELWFERPQPATRVAYESYPHEESY